MLKSLKIKNLATIESVNIDFNDGFTVVTGETGAGKSVFLSGLKLISGEKASSQLLRYGAKKGLAEAIFDVSKYPNILNHLNQLEIDIEDNEIIIQREINDKGKSRARINGIIVPLSTLNKLAKKLVQLHGQSEQILLKEIRTHLDIIDKYANSDKTLSLYKNQWNDLQKSIKLKHDTEARIKNLAEQKEFLEFQYKELEKANLKENEENDLDKKLQSLESSEEIGKVKQEMETIFEFSDNAILPVFRKVISQLRSLENISDEYKVLAERIQQSTIDITDIYQSFKSIKTENNFNPIFLDNLNSKMATIQRLKRKYRCDFNGLIELRNRRAKELQDLNNIDDDLTDLENEIKNKKNILNKTAQTLSDLRKNAAKQFELEIKKNLESLDMLQAEFQVNIQKTDTMENGIDKIEFLLSPNPGEKPKSLSNAVSGGELSRVMLALKTSLAHKDSIPLLLFDEVDSGISGQVGHKIGKALEKLGKFHQVLTITHLHQVASRAENQLFVDKKVIDGKTHTSIISLKGESRIKEISRMMGGDNSETALAHAKDLLNNK